MTTIGTSNSVAKQHDHNGLRVSLLPQSLSKSTTVVKQDSTWSWLAILWLASPLTLLIRSQLWSMQMAIMWVQWYFSGCSCKELKLSFQSNHNFEQLLNRAVVKHIYLPLSVANTATKNQYILFTLSAGQTSLIPLL